VELVTYACMYAFLYVYMYARMYVRTYLSTYVWLYLCGSVRYGQTPTIVQHIYFRASCDTAKRLPKIKSDGERSKKLHKMCQDSWNER
jgi:hypothetical protein